MSGIKHLSHVTGAVFRFLLYKLGIEPRSTVLKNSCLTIRQFANLPRSAAPVASCLVRHKIQHSSCLLPCELLNHASRIRNHPSSLALPSCLSLRVRLNDYPLVYSIHQFGSLQLGHHSLLELTDWLCSYPFGLQH